MENKKILITGSSGMIGSELVNVLKANNCIVHGLDRTKTVFADPDKYIKHDLRVPIYLDEQYDYIIHLAANARVIDLIKNPNLALENAITTFNAIEYARKTHTKFIFASSREIYGNGQKLPIDEKQGSQRTIESPYSASKLFGEALVYSYISSYGLDAKIVRFSNVYGKYDYSDRFIPKMINLMRENEPVEIWGEDKILDFTYITDAAKGVLCLLENWHEAQAIEYNIASGEKYSLFEVAGKLIILLKSQSQINFLPVITGEVHSFQADISRIKKYGWEPAVDLMSGLEKTISWYNNNPNA